MRKSEVTAEFLANIQTVWDVVTNNMDFVWRSDLERIEITGEHTFIEYTKEGFKTEFTITNKTPHEFYAFDMKNERFIGSWLGEFSETENGGTMIRFTEYIDIKNPIIEFFSYFFMNLKKIQEQYVCDLRLRLGE
ncbi:hypothetical protein [Culicoidibacter larvae]|uniref:Polyketide cyclase n=1 Tax=Culicoidibacter larvae TaxID=2579976 RepID=A0A5R8Q7R6_9FIRM|nr:hypothetical protein [Culicoidibacter larvae]TLG71526.1 hypothetical protein FEZ08_10555 [Culicoidibacter larvae]